MQPNTKIRKFKTEQRRDGSRSPQAKQRSQQRRQQRRMKVAR
jgi:hypothetical protein